MTPYVLGSFFCMTEQNASACLCPTGKWKSDRQSPATSDFVCDELAQESFFPFDRTRRWSLDVETLVESYQQVIIFIVS